MEASQPIPMTDMPLPAQPPPRQEPSRLRVAGAVALVTVLVFSALFATIIVARIDVNFNLGGDGQQNHLYPDNMTLDKSYQWTYDGHSYSLHLNITAGEYYEYKDRSVDRSPTYEPTMIQYVTSSDVVVIELATKLDGMAHNLSYDNYHTLDFMLAFVQGIGYSYDNVSTGHEDYWRYSVETLWDHTGDCEDLSILYASILEASGHDAVLLMFPSASHMAAGVDCPGATGTYFAYGSVDYFYCETTAQGWHVGEEPPAIQGNPATVLQVS